jgi:hypothetical protein
MSDAPEARITVVHLHTGSDGRSHFTDRDLALEPVRRGLGVELLDAVQGVLIRELPEDYSIGMHTAPRRQIVIQLSGEGSITTGDGSTRTFGPGDILLADDLTGEGHRSDTLATPRRQLVIYLDPELDLDAITRES